MFMAKRKEKKINLEVFSEKWIKIFISSALKGEEPVNVSSSGKILYYPPTFINTVQMI